MKLASSLFILSGLAAVVAHPALHVRECDAPVTGNVTEGAAKDAATGTTTGGETTTATETSVTETTKAEASGTETTASNPAETTTKPAETGNPTDTTGAPGTTTAPTDTGAPATDAPTATGTDSAANATETGADTCGSEPKGICYMPKPIPEFNGTTDFTNVGMMLFPNYDGIDVFGPLDALWLLSMGTQKLNLHFIAETMDPVSGAITGPANTKNSSFGAQIVPTATFADFDGDLDLLIIPGGPFTFGANLTAGVDFVKRYDPKVKILATICTGATVAARAGVLDGRVATTNKQAWQAVTADGPNVQWAAPARYVRDGKYWTASGVTSGIDLIHSFIKAYWGEEQADSIADGIEHIPASPRDDPFTYKAKNMTGAVPLCTEYVGW